MTSSRPKIVLGWDFRSDGWRPSDARGAGRIVVEDKLDFVMYSTVCITRWLREACGNTYHMDRLENKKKIQRHVLAGPSKCLSSASCKRQAQVRRDSTNSLRRVLSPSSSCNSSFTSTVKASGLKLVPHHLRKVTKYLLRCHGPRLCAFSVSRRRCRFHSSLTRKKYQKPIDVGET